MSEVRPDGERIVKVETEVEFIRKDLDQIKEDLRLVRDTLTQAKGGWKTLMLVAGLSSTVGAIIAKASPWFLMK